MDLNLKMQLSLIFLLAVVPCGWNAVLTECNEDSHCSENFYCEMSAFYCRECLSCEQFKRAAPALRAVSCVKSVTECGPCLGGDSYGRNGDNMDCDGGVKNANVETGSHSREIKLPVYAWVLIVIIVVIILTVVFVIKSSIMNRITYSLVCRTDGTRSTIFTRSEFPASAPEAAPPPAYNTLYAGVESPIQDGAVKHENSMNIEQVAATEPSYESAGRQAAVPYNHPLYVRGTGISSSELSPSSDTQSTTSNAQSAVGVMDEEQGTSQVDAPMRNSAVENISADNEMPGASSTVGFDDTSPTSTDLVNAKETNSDVEPSRSMYPTNRNKASSSAGAARNGSPVIVVNNIVNLQACTISESNSCSS